MVLSLNDETYCVLVWNHNQRLILELYSFWNPQSENTWWERERERLQLTLLTQLTERNSIKCPQLFLCLHRLQHQQYLLHSPFNLPAHPWNRWTLFKAQFLLPWHRHEGFYEPFDATSDHMGSLKSQLCNISSLLHTPIWKCMQLSKEIKGTHYASNLVFKISEVLSHNML